MGSAVRLPNGIFGPPLASQRLSKPQLGNTLLCEAAFGRIIEITKEGEICWEYVREYLLRRIGIFLRILQVTPYFAAYPEVEARKMFPMESNALFRAYKYAAEEIPWLHS